MPEWISLSPHSLVNRDHIVAVRRMANGRAAVVLINKPDARLETGILYDDLVEQLDGPKYEVVRIE